MTDPYRDSGRRSAGDYGSDYSYGAPYSNSTARGGRRRAADADADLDGFLSELSGGGSGGRAPVGRASVGRRSGGRDSYDSYGSSGGAAAGRASVGRAPAGRAAVGSASVSGAGAASGRARVRPGSPYDDPYGPGPGGPGGPYGPRGPYGPGDGRPGRRRADRHRRSEGERARKRRRRQKLAAIIAVSVMLLGFVVLAGTYYVVNVPTPDQLAGMSQNSKILFSDGKSTMAKVGDENRKVVNIKEIPKHVRRAVVTAEDRSFYENSGVDVRGIMRAAWNNLTDDDTEGASTITQQYARNAANLDRGQSYTRKVREMAMAVKLNRQYGKDKILEMYLNTIYFGRNANGIGAAAEAYFGKSVEKLTVEEGALLASVIKNPHGYDPANTGPERAQSRMRWVLKGMVDMKWLEAEQAAEAELPKTQDPKKATGAQYGLDKPTGAVVKYVERELEAMGITPKQLRENGYTVQTTIDKKMQKAAEDAAHKILKGQSKKLASALVAVEPGTGKVKAYYGGDKGAGWDNASAHHQPGSSLKAYVLAAAIEDGTSVRSYWDGSSPQEFPDRERPLRNSDNNNQCKRCTLERATVLSLNTTYYALTSKVGKDKVIELASKAGIRSMSWPNDEGEYEKIDLTQDPAAASKKFSNEVGIGQYPISVLDNASGFATFAAEGTAAKTHFVTKVMQDDQVIKETEIQTQQAFKPETAADASAVMRKVVSSGSDDLFDGRPSAGKTGTWQYGNTEHNAHAWMAGYTPQLAAAVWMGRSGEEGAIRTKEGAKIYGSGLPADIWKTFMSKVHKGKQVKQFPKPQYLGDVGAGNKESPSPSPEPTESKKPGDAPPTKPGDEYPTGEPTTEPTKCRGPFCPPDETGDGGETGDG